MDITGLWRKVPVRDDTDWLMLPYGARGLYLQLWRKLDNDGRLNLGKHGLRGVCGHVGTLADWPVIEPDLKALLDAGELTFDDATGHLFVPRFVAAQGAYVMSPEATKKRGQRARSQGQQGDMSPDRQDTSGTCRTELELEENKKRTEEEEAKASSSAVGLAPPPPTPTPTAPSLPGLDPGTLKKPSKAPRSKSATASNPELQTLAVALLGELSAAIQSVRPSARELRPIPGNLEHIAERLADGATADEVRHVIAVYAAESRHNEKSLQYFNPVSPFRRDNFARALARTVADASKPERQRAPPWRPDPSIGSNPGEHTPAKDWDSWRNR